MQISFAQMNREEGIDTNITFLNSISCYCADIFLLDNNI